MARALYALNPSSLKTPLTARGNPSFKLEKLAELNNLPIEFAHDALSDENFYSSRLFWKEKDNLGQLQMTMNKEKAIDCVQIKVFVI